MNINPSFPQISSLSWEDLFLTLYLAIPLKVSAADRLVAAGLGSHCRGSVSGDNASLPSAAATAPCSALQPLWSDSSRTHQEVRDGQRLSLNSEEATSRGKLN